MENHNSLEESGAQQWLYSLFAPWTGTAYVRPGQANSPIPACHVQGASLGESNSLLLEWALLGGFHHRAIPTLQGDKWTAFPAGQTENFGVILDASFFPLSVHLLDCIQHLFSIHISQCL